MLRKRCAGPLLLVLLTVTGCQLTQSAFSRTVGNAGAVFSAASTTLSYAHEGKITSAYAQASFVNYQSELDGLDQQLPSQQGALINAPFSTSLIYTDLRYRRSFSRAWKNHVTGRPRLRL